MSEPTRTNWNAIFWVASTIIGIVGSLYIVDNQNKINHRLDVRDAKEWKRLVDGNKGRDAERQALKEFAQKVLAHCAQQKDGCELPPEMTVIPQNPEITPLEQLMATNME